MSLSRPLWLSAAREGAVTELFDRAYRDHHARIFRLCLRFAAGDRAWAMDRTHDAFVRLAEQLPSLTDQGELGGWLYRVAVNICLMDLRRQRGFRAVMDRIGRLVEKGHANPEREARSHRDVSRLELALGGLPPKQRTIIVLVHLEGRTQSEVAAILSLSEGQVSKLHKKAIATLREGNWEIDDE